MFMHPKREYLWGAPLKIVFLLSAVLLVSCGGGSSGGDDDSDNAFDEMDGRWRGNLEDPTGTMHTLTISISGKSITSVRSDGADLGLTGTLVQSAADVFGFSLSDGTTGGFIVDSARQHMTCVDSNSNVGVLQKDAGALPPFVQLDLEGGWNGAVITTDLVTFQESTGDIACDAAGGCNGFDDQAGNYTAILTYTNLGRWSGTKIFATGTASMSVLMSEDKKFAGSWACDFTAGAFPDACSFTAWSFN